MHRIRRKKVIFMIYWKHNNDLIAGTTLRNPNKKEANNMALHCGGSLAAVIENRKHLLNKYGLTLDQAVFANQIHSDHIKCVGKQDLGKGTVSIEDAIMDCDALYTRETELFIGVFTADCVPVLLYDPIEGIICAIHSGWMGTVKQITSKALHVLMEQEGCKPENIHAYIGPAIAFSSFEVGLEVVARIKALPFDTSNYIQYKNEEKALVDNKGLNVQMLRNAGVLEKNITVDKNDTFANNESFFSYRRDHSCGRHLSFIVRKA